ncbi:hypothetical protein VTJ83DRAFT_1506 [Remersonia thermophila]|uniref:Uncharacterized protein n=1 Tax=Remersonia thermophila TaxID=72144 RepID=A0ABR4DGD0_9PEZI
MGWALNLRRETSPEGDAAWSPTLGWLPSASQQQEGPGEGNVVRSSSDLRGTASSRARELWPLVSLWVFLAVFSVLYSVYVYKSLLSDDPAIGHWLPSASDTNLVVSVLSQVFANSIDLLLLGVFDVLRWQLAARFPGVSAATFFQLSSSTGWVPMLFLTLNRISSGGIGLIRLLLPLLGLYFGSSLKFKAEFVYFFKQNSVGTPVFAGSGMPMNEGLLSLLPASYVAVFYAAWIPTLLDVPKYAVPFPIPGCEGSCTSSFLPGGIETARKIAPYLNMTLLRGGTFRDAETIQIRNAPGILLRFDTPGADFDFDRDKDCHTYGKHLNDTLQVCIRPVDDSLAFGWKACPSRLFQQRACLNDTSWLADPLPKTVLMTRYKQFATTAFSGRDFSIRHVQPTSEPILERVNASTYLAVLNALYNLPDSNPGTTRATSYEHDVAMTHAVAYGTTWLIRLYDDVFPDDIHTPISHVRNFLAIPHQFMAACQHFANYTVANLSGIKGAFPLPDDMQTVAVSGNSTTRLLGLDWVVWTYIAATAAVVMIAGGLVMNMLTREEPIPESSGFVEVDLAARFGADSPTLSGSGPGRAAPPSSPSTAAVAGDDALRAIRELAQPRASPGPVLSSSTFRIAKELRRRKIRIISVPSSSSEGRLAGSSRHRAFAFREGVYEGNRPGGDGGGGRTELSALERADTEITSLGSPLEGPKMKW